MQHVFRRFVVSLYLGNPGIIQPPIDEFVIFGSATSLLLMVFLSFGYAFLTDRQASEIVQTNQRSFRGTWRDGDGEGFFPVCLCSCVFTERILSSSEVRSEEHTSELQSHSFISYAVFC